MEPSFKVLIVDDDHALCEALSEVVTRAGCVVECLVDGSNLFAPVSATAPDLLILEISAPQGGRLELLRRLEGRRSTARIPIIVISNQASLEYELLDIYDFIPKPVDLQRLQEDIAHLREKRKDSRQTPYPPMEKGDLEIFQEYLVLHSGLHFDVRNSKILERGLMRRMQALHLAGYRDYFRYLSVYSESRQELKKLLGLLTIGETYFFRYFPHFEALINDVFPEIIERNREERTLRIWSAGCSSGEEPYTLAMILLTHFPELAEWDIRILATDINKRALKRAKEGIYRPRALRVTEPYFRETFFREIGGLFHLDPIIREMVDFDYLNLQTGDFPSVTNGTTEIDILFCRNVMIYFRFETMKGIVEKMTDALRPGGYLFLGHAETLLNVSNRFQRVHKAGGFFYRMKPDGELSTPPLLQPPPPPRKALPLPVVPVVAVKPKSSPVKTPDILKPIEPRPNLEELYKNALQAAENENFKTASQNYDTILRHDGRHVGALVGKGFIMANEGAYGVALEYCKRALKENDLCPEAYFLRGLIFEQQSELSDAVAEYRKSLLLDMNFIMPHYHLGKVFWKLERHRDARRELDNTVRLLEVFSDEKIVPYSGGLSRAVFLEVCREDAVHFLATA